MSDPAAIGLLLAGFAALLALRVPIAFSLAISSALTALALGLPPAQIVQQMCSGVSSVPLMAIPFFILAGEIMARGGIALRLIDLANLFVGRIRGGLAMVNILASMLFGGISGSSVADTSSIGSILIPMMKRKGYGADYAVDVTITSSTQGIIIPPSHNAVIYALAAGSSVSIARLFLAGIVPGIMVGLSLMVVAYAIAVRRGYPRETFPGWRQGLRVGADAFLGLLTAVIIVGGVLTGKFTATESSAVAVVYAFLVTFLVYRDISIRAFPGILRRSVSVIAMVMFLIASAKAFGFLLAYLQVPARATRVLLGVAGDNRIVLLLLINGLLLVLGCIMDMAPLILITTPILLPVVRQVGVDPVHFGIVMMLNLGIGLCTPPVGSTLFVGCAIGDVSIERVARSLPPFYIAMVVVLLLVTYLPQITMAIPNLWAGP